MKPSKQTDKLNLRSGPQAYDSVSVGFISKRRRPQLVNIVSVALSLAMPFLLFAAISGVMSFHLRFSKPGLVCFTVTCGGFIPVICGIVAMQMYKRRRLGESVPSTWFLFLCITSLIAWASGVVLGDANYEMNTWRYYEWANLKLYPHVDPEVVAGQAVLDAGRLVFTPGSRLDRNRSVSFKSIDTYCAAPVVSSDRIMGSYDFWATGVNCCGDSVVNASLRGGSVAAGTNFQCGKDVNATGAGGLRVLDDHLIPFYRLAVEQAVSKYRINAHHPIFLTWVQDPVGEVNAYADRAVKNYLFRVFLFFGLQLFLVAFGLVVVSRRSE